MAWTQIQPFLVALAIGLMLGFERERNHTGSLPAGSRSFALLALGGAVAASFQPWAVVAGLCGLAALMVTAYYRTSADDPGTTTEIAALVAYLLGALAYTRSAVAVALAVVVVALLASKTRIHRFAREAVSEVELEDAIKFFAVAFVVLPLLPDRDLGPYGILNPSKLWLLVVLITGIGWIGYIGVRALGPTRGLLVTGLAGGFVSATATTASMARLSRSAGVRAPLAGALIASLATFVQLMVVIGFISPELLSRLWPSTLAGAVALIGVAALVYLRDHREETQYTDARPATRPFSLRPALVLATVLTAALVFSRWATEVLGTRGAVLAALTTGLADAHAGAVASASLAAKGDLTLDTALVAIAAAMGSNLVVKCLLAFTGGGRRFGFAFLAGVAVPAVVFAAGIVLTIRLA